MKPFVPEGAPVAATLAASATSVADGSTSYFQWLSAQSARLAPSHISLENRTGFPVVFKLNATSTSADSGGSAEESHGQLANDEVRNIPVVGITRIAVSPIGGPLINVGDGAGADKNFWCLGWFRTAAI